MLKGHILKTPQQDFLYLYLPGIFSIVLTYAFNLKAESWASTVILFLALGFLDSGHVYTTLWRTYFHKSERTRRPFYYTLMPLGLFVCLFIWIYLGGFLLGPFVIYYTLYHNIRQFYGMSKWHQKKESVFDNTSDVFLYALCSISVIGAHFNPGMLDVSYYPQAQILFYPNHFLLNLCRVVFYLCLLAWFLHERKRAFSFRTLSVAFPALLYGHGFLYGTHFLVALVPLVVSHGLSYITLMNISLKKTSDFSKWGGLVVLTLTALLLGGGEFFIEEGTWDPSSKLNVILTAFILTCLLCHYLFDAFLWRKDHPEAPAIYNA